MKRVKPAEAKLPRGHQAPPPPQGQQAPIKTAPKLMDMADVVLIEVLSFFHFYERPKLCTLCSRLNDVIGSMPPPPNSALEVRLTTAPTPAPSSTDAQPDRWTIALDKEGFVARVNATLDSCWQ